MAEKQRILTFGLTEEQNGLVQKCVPTRDYEVFDTDCPTDLIAIPSPALIIHAAKMDDENIEMIFDFYSEVNGCTDETVIWLGEPKPPVKLRKTLKCYDSFADIEENLKYILLSAHSKRKKTAEYSKKLADGIKILSLIRKYPGIKTQELAEKLELKSRTVQRYIAALQATGEWIEYDPQKRGWVLFHGVSILFGDVWEDAL